MNVKRLFFWAACFLALFGYTAVFEKPAPEKGAKEIRQQEDFPKVFLLDREAIKEIQLRRDGKSARILKKGKAWEIAAPPNAGLQKELIEGLVTALTDAVTLGVVEENPVSLDQFGLAQPAITASIFLQEKPEPVTLLIGANSPSEISVYAKIESEKKVIMLGTYLTFSIKMFMDNIR
ncbi:MAG: DUF4340 domain-containing protein [Pseudomonadota bacterium]